MKNVVYSRSWWFILMCLSSSLGVAAQCAYNTTMCTCAFSKITCIGLTTPPELIDGLNNTSWTTVEFYLGDLTTLPALPPGIERVVFYKVPLNQFSYLDPSAIFFHELKIHKANFRELPEVFQKLQNLRELEISYTPMEDWDNRTLASLGRTLTTLSLDNVTMREWPPGFSLLNNLKHLYIINLSIPSLPDDAFSNMTDSLSSLELLYLGITSIPASLFSLRNVTSLSLSGNKLTDVKSVFDKMSSSPLTNTLTSLSVDSMELSEMPDLTNFTSLTYVTLENNPISTINMDALPSTLTSFVCSNCSLSSIPLQVHRLSNLKTLCLSTNQIKQINFDSIPVTVTSLYLNDNNITEFACQSTNITASLQKLSLQRNLLSVIPACIQNLSRLSWLNLMSNQIAEIYFDSFPPNLTYLELQDNKISNILPSNSTTPSILNEIDLNYNPIAHIDPSAFINLIHLKTLRMVHAQLTRPPTALTSLTALTDLTIFVNPLGSCQCPVDTGLSQWFESRNGSLHIVGACEFFVDIQVYLTGYCDRLTTTLASVQVTITTSHNSGVILGQTFISHWFCYIPVLVYMFLVSYC